MSFRRTNSRRLPAQRGQIFVAVVILMAVLLLVVLGVATDYTQVWAHRQMAQAAADAACEAAAADLYLDAINPNYPLDFSWIGTSFDCSAKPNVPPCVYARLNGYTGSNVQVSFPSSLSVSNPVPGYFGVAHPYVKVTIADPVAMSFTKLVSTPTLTVHASAGCGLNPIVTPIPLVVLNQTSSGTLFVNTGASVKILGGPKRSVQVDSSNSTAVNVLGLMDLSQAGPTSTGADFGVFGGPTTKPSTVNLGTTGNWYSPTNPLGDPWMTVPTPNAPATAGTARPVAFTVNGCPNPNSCVEFSAGNYTSCQNSVAAGGNGCLISPSFTTFGTDWQASHAYNLGDLTVPATNNSNHFMFQAQKSGTSGTTQPVWKNVTPVGSTVTDSGVTWKNMGPVSSSPGTAIFDPGLYYVGTGGLKPGPNTTMRVSTATGDGSSGILFYFSTSSSVAIGNNTGKSPACTSVTPGTSSWTMSPNNCVVSYAVNGSAQTGTSWSLGSPPLQCPSGGPNPPQIPSKVDGNILLGPCSGTYGDANVNRGFLFFQSRATAANGGACTGGLSGNCAILGGGGSFIFSGFTYFHNSAYGTSCGTDSSCLSLSGGSGANSFTLGDIVVDEISLTGASSIKMILNPSATFQILRPQLLL